MGSPVGRKNACPAKKALLATLGADHVPVARPRSGRVSPRNSRSPRDEIEGWSLTTSPSSSQSASSVCSNRSITSTGFLNSNGMASAQSPTLRPAAAVWFRAMATFSEAFPAWPRCLPPPWSSTAQSWTARLSSEARAIEDAVLARIYASLGVPAPTPEIVATVKEADFRAALAEGTCGCSGRGYVETQTGYRYDEEAIRLLRDYLDQYQVVDALHPDGCWPLAYEKRLRLALRAAQHHVSYAPDREVDTPSVVPLRPPLQNAPTTPTSRILDAIEDLYAGLEHRPSCQMVKDTIVAAINSGSRELAR